MKKRVGVAVVAAVAGLVGSAVAIVPGIASGSGEPGLGTSEFNANTKQLIARLSGSAEVPGPGDPAASGIANISIDPATNQICWAISVSGFAEAPSAAHIHEGATGVAGPVKVNLFPPLPPQGGGTSSGCTTDATNAPLIAANPAGFYVNVHTPVGFPNGAIRGQLANAVQSTVLLPVPLRAYDSRLGDGKLEAGQTRTIGLATGKDASNANQIAVPPGATAAVVNLTITNTEGAGFVKMYSAAISEPSTSSINWSETGQNLAVSTPVAVDGQGRIKLTGGVAPTDVVVDVIGYII